MISSLDLNFHSSSLAFIYPMDLFFDFYSWLSCILGGAVDLDKVYGWIWLILIALAKVDESYVKETLAECYWIFSNSPDTFGKETETLFREARHAETSWQIVRQQKSDATEFGKDLELRDTRWTVTSKTWQNLAKDTKFWKAKFPNDKIKKHGKIDKIKKEDIWTRCILGGLLRYQLRWPHYKEWLSHRGSFSSVEWIPETKWSLKQHRRSQPTYRSTRLFWDHLYWR